MSMKDYSDEFRADAVALYESTPGATLRGIAADLGVSRGTLRDWVVKARAGRGEEPSLRGPRIKSETVGKPPSGRVAELEAQVRKLEAEKALLTTEREILRKAAKYFAGGDELVNRFQFVADHLDTFEVKRMCVVLGINRSSYYKWVAGAAKRAVRQAADQALAEQIRAVHAEWDTTYGAPRITPELADKTGRPVNEKRVARVMRRFGIVGLHLRKKVRTTVPATDAPMVPDLLERDFTADAPNRKYVGDITYLPTGDGQFLYLATVIDCFNRRLVGWAIADHMRDTLVIDALEAAQRERGSLAGAIFHSDNGAQYCSAGFLAACARLGVTVSRGKVGTSADNALAESFNAALKRETLQGKRRWDGARACRLAVFRWIIRYNTRRRHSYCGYLSPIDYENAHT
ncbi:IS3 family transposase, partial [Promicromonospora umidemergens]